MPASEDVASTFDMRTGALAERGGALDTAAIDERAAAARSPRTRRAYAADWEHFVGWCQAAGYEPMPAQPTTVRLYLTDLETARSTDGHVLYQPATLARRLAAIAATHRDAGHPTPTRDPVVTAVLTGIKRARAHPPHQMRPLLLDDLRTLLARMDFAHWPAGLTAARDAVVLLAGFAGALRRSELAALTVGDLTWHPTDGLHLRIRSSKTDQDATGTTIALPYGRHPGTCPPCAVLRWLHLLHAATHGRPPVMRAVLATPAWAEQHHLYPHPEPQLPVASAAAEADRSVYAAAHPPPLPPDTPLVRGIRKGGTLLDTAITGAALHAMVRRRAHDAALPGLIGFHSLRAGFVTQARRAGADHRAVRRQTRYTTDAMIDPYDRDQPPLASNAVTNLGL